MQTIGYSQNSFENMARCEKENKTKNYDTKYFSKCIHLGIGKI